MRLRVGVGAPNPNPNLTLTLTLTLALTLALALALTLALATLSRHSSLSSRLEGLRSRCTRSPEWQYSSAFSVWYTMNCLCT